jgi:hypothetical protein
MSMGEEAREAVEKHPEAAGDILGPSYPVEGLKAQQSHPRIWLVSCKSGLFRRSLCARQATGSLHETRHARNNVGQCATCCKGWREGGAGKYLMVLCFIGSPVRGIGYAARETAARRERVHARDTKKDGERERASESASDRRTSLRSVALEDQPEKHSMGKKPLAPSSLNKVRAFELLSPRLECD